MELKALYEDGRLYFDKAVNINAKKVPVRVIIDDECINQENFLEESDNSKVIEKPKKINFIDLSAQQDKIRSKLEKNIQKVLNHGQYIMGPEIQEIEQRLAEFVGAEHCIGCSSGTDALLMSLMSYDIGPGDAVFTSTFSFFATAEVIALLGATPIFVDIDLQTFNIDPDQLKLAIEAVESSDPSLYPLPCLGENQSKSKNHKLRPKAIIAVDLFGLPADYHRINKVAKDHGLLVVEDAAQSLGGEYQGNKAGNLGDIGCTSFFPAKPLAGYGDSGAVFTNEDQVADKLRSLRVHGQGSDKYEHVQIGLNARLDSLQAAVLLAKMDIFPKEIEKRQKVAARYTDFIGSSNLQVKNPYIPSGYLSAWAQYSVLAQGFDHREKIQKKLKDAGIPSVIYYPKPLHLQKAFEYLSYEEGQFPVAEDYSQRIFSLPMHPYLSEEEQKIIIKELKV